MVNPPFFKDYDEKRDFLAGLNAAGPDAVRKALIAGRYKGARLSAAKVWLEQADVDAAALRERDDRAVKQAAIELAREANEIAQGAAERASTANSIAVAALIIAIMGMAVSVIVTLVTRGG